HAAVHLVGRDVLDMGGHRPAVSPRVDEAAGAVAVEPQAHRLDLTGAQLHGGDEGGVGVGDVDVQAHRSAADGLRIEEADLGGRVAEHEHGPADHQLAVCYPAIRPGQPHALGGAEDPLVELDGLGGAVDGQPGRQRRVSGGNGVDIGHDTPPGRGTSSDPASLSPRPPPHESSGGDDAASVRRQRGDRAHSPAAHSQPAHSQPARSSPHTPRRAVLAARPHFSRRARTWAAVSWASNAVSEASGAATEISTGVLPTWTSAAWATSVVRWLDMTSWKAVLASPAGGWSSAPSR